DATDKRVVILMEIGDIDEKYRRRNDAALKADRAAYELDATCFIALRALALLSRKQKKIPELLEVLQEQSERNTEPEARAELYVELAETKLQVGYDVDGAIDAYLAAVSANSTNKAALDGLSRLAR